MSLLPGHKDRSASYKKAIFVPIALSLSMAAMAQCPAVDFDIPPTLCRNEALEIDVDENSAYGYEWDFCSGDFDSSLLYKRDIVGASPLIHSPYHIEIVEDGSLYRGFVLNNGSKNIVRYDFING